MGRRGSFRCVEYTGQNSLLSKGPLKLSANRRYMVHSDGTPFFWPRPTLPGTASSKPSPRTGMNTSQRESLRDSRPCSSLQHRGRRFYDSTLAYTEKDDIRINPEFFKRLDPKVKAINEAGLVASPVMMWAVGGKDPSHELSERDAIRLGKYIVARWGAHNVVWILAGDGVYLGKRAERMAENWKSSLWRPAQQTGNNASCWFPVDC